MPKLLMQLDETTSAIVALKTEAGNIIVHLQNIDLWKLFVLTIQQHPLILKIL